MRKYPDQNLDSGHVITTWFDRKTRLWVTQLKDAEGNQIGNAEFDADDQGVRSARALIVLNIPSNAIKFFR